MTPTLKERLFTTGSDALTCIGATTTKRYACPICTLWLEQDALDSGDLTLEHVPPESVGGKGIALTCRRCNSTAGHTVDAALHGRERFFELGRIVSGRGGEFEGSVTITVDGIATNAYLIFRDGTFTIEVPERINNPRNFQGQMQSLRDRRQQNSGEDIRLDLNARIKFNFDRSRVSDLRSAFLAAFAQFGYRYALHPRLNIIREQILQPDSALIDGAWWIAGSEFTENPMMMVLTDPFPAVLVRLRAVLVVLPWLQGPDDLYSAIRQYFASQSEHLIYDHLEWPTGMIMLLDFHGRPVASEES